MNIEIPKEIASRTDLLPIAKILYGALTAYPGYTNKELANAIGSNERTVYRALNQLKKCEVLEEYEAEVVIKSNKFRLKRF